MFVTQALVSSNVGGQAGAASFCTANALDAGLPGSYVAWLSTGVAAPGPNLARKQNVPIVRPDCERLAADLDHLIATGPEVSPDVTERGLPLEGNDCKVWTSTTPLGAPANASTCNDWAGDAGGSLAVVGLCTAQADSGYWTWWTDFSAYLPCDQPARLYCLQN
jgi:hypothetical protein